MTNTMNNLSQVFTEQNHDIQSEYQGLFNELMDYKNTQEKSNWARGFTEIINDYLNKNSIDISQFPTHTQYSRNYIGKEKSSGWQAMISRWEPGAISTIHGHPDFIFYYVIEGEFKMPFFEKTQTSADTVKHTETKVITPSDTVWSIGSPGCFDNMIHQVKATKPSLALHIFSDDGLKGEIFKCE